MSVIRVFQRESPLCRAFLLASAGRKVFCSSRMIFLRVSVLALACLAALAAPAATKPKPARPGAGTSHDGSYKGAIVVDAADGNVIYEDQADIVSPPASMTKLMTFAVVQDKLASGAITLATPVRISPSDAGIGGSQVYLDPRETFPVEELLYAMMIHSANDAAHALARASGGSVEAFVEAMNAKARELGMAHTTFRTPHGLPPSNRKIADGDLTTPRDFALLARYLLQKTDVLKYTSIRTRQFGAGVRPQPTEMTNSDHLIGQVAGVDGLKTGFTNGAGFCLTSTAQRGGRRVLVVLMGSPASTTRDLKVTELLEKGFAALPPAPPTVPTITEASPTAAVQAVIAAPASPPPPAQKSTTSADAPPAIKFTPPAKKK